MTSDRPGTQWRRSPTVLWRSTNGLVLLEADGAVLELGASGPVVWDLLEVGGTTDQFVAELAQRYGSPADVISTDVERLLHQLRDAKAIVAF